MDERTLSDAIALHLSSASLPPKAAWLSTFLPSIRPSTPLPALKKTALFRILASDITNSVLETPGSVFPPDITSGTVPEARLSGPIPVQVLDVQDIGRSRWSQVELIEATERGETTRGRQVIRLVPGQDGDEPAAPDAQSATGPHKLVLQDSAGRTAYALEIVPIDGIGVDMSIGTKFVLKSVTVARGVLMLDPNCVEVLGGKVESIHKVWREGRKARLMKEAGMAESG